MKITSLSLKKFAPGKFFVGRGGEGGGGNVQYYYNVEFNFGNDW